MVKETNNNSNVRHPNNSVNVRHATSYINSFNRKVLEYVTPDSIVLDLPFIMTCSKRLTKNMPYMKLEKFLADTHVAAIRLLNFHDKEGMIYLNVQELENGRTYKRRHGCGSSKCPFSCHNINKLLFFESVLYNTGTIFTLKEVLSYYKGTLIYK